MDLQVLLIICGVGVAGAAVLLLMGLFSTSGTSYEEAIAQQRKATTELLALVDNKNKNKKNAKKANKKLAKKEKTKDNTTTATASEPESETYAESGVDEEPALSSKLHVDFSPSVVVDEPRDTPPNSKIRKRGKDTKLKPILTNKEDPSCVNDPNTPMPDIANHFEEMHPKDDFELLHSSLVGKKEEVVEKKDAKTVKQPKQAKSSSKITSPAPELDEGSRERRNSGDAPKEQRKAVKKTEKKSITEDTEEAQEEVVPALAAIQPSELTTVKLLKQAMSSAPMVSVPSQPAKNKKKKNETPTIASVIAAGESGVLNVNELVRVMREASLSRNDIQILTDALLNMHHDLLPEHSEWSEGPNDPMQKLKKQLADKEKALADEIEASQAIHAKLKELRASLNTERARAAAAAAAAAAATATQRSEAHAQLERVTRQMQQDNMLLQSKLAAEAEAQTQRVQMEMHIQRLSESEAGLVQQLNALQAELNARVLELNQARCEVGTTRDSMMQHANDYAQQLQESQRALSELEAARAAAVLNEQRAAHELRLARERLHGMSELQNEVQRLNGRVQAAEAEADKYKQEVEQLKQQLSEATQLKEQLASREAELAELRAIKPAPAHNGLPANNETFKAAELAKVESVVESLRSELVAAQEDCREQKSHIQRLAEQLAATKDKNNEALTKSQEAQYKEIAAVLRGACPAAAPGSTPDRSWLDTFASNLKLELNKTQLKEVVKIEKVTDDKRVSELQAQNEHLQQLVNKYKIIIDETEALLSRLQSDATTVEEKWQLQLEQKQRELDQLRQTTEQMQGKINELQEELQKVKSSSHNHSFVDAEKFTQEKILSGLSGRPSVDVCNGPSKVGLEEK